MEASLERGRADEERDPLGGSAQVAMRHMLWERWGGTVELLTTSIRCALPALLGECIVLVLGCNELIALHHEG